MSDFIAAILFGFVKEVELIYLSSEMGIIYKYNGSSNISVLQIVSTNFGIILTLIKNRNYILFYKE
jgi:hypothetical protein